VLLVPTVVRLKSSLSERDRGSAGSQQRRFQFQECAQQFVRMDNVAATFAMSVNNPTPRRGYERSLLTEMLPISVRPDFTEIVAISASER